MSRYFLYNSETVPENRTGYREGHHIAVRLMSTNGNLPLLFEELVLTNGPALPYDGAVARLPVQNHGGIT